MTAPDAGELARPCSGCKAAESIIERREGRIAELDRALVAAMEEADLLQQKVTEAFDEAVRTGHAALTREAALKAENDWLRRIKDERVAQDEQSQRVLGLISTGTCERIEAKGGERCEKRGVHPDFYCYPCLARASLAGAPAQEPAKCTSATARWCPVHGDCACLAREASDMDDPRCPLHNVNSTHAVPSELPPQKEEP